VGAKSKSKAQIDPKLSKALRSAHKDDTVEAVLMFDNQGGTAAKTHDVDDLKHEIAKLSSGDDLEANYFPSLGSVAVRAKPGVVKRLLKHPRLAVAALNRDESDTETAL
jgi:hypothetical protein